MFMLFQFLLDINFFLRTFESWCHRASDSLTAQANGFNELLGLPGIGLIFEAVLRPSDNSVEDAPFLFIVFAWADPSTVPQIVLGLKLQLESIEIRLGSCCREDVTVHTGHQ